MSRLCPPFNEVNIVSTSHKSPLDVRPTSYWVGPVSASIFGGINLESSVDLERSEVTEIFEFGSRRINPTVMGANWIVDEDPAFQTAY